MGIQAAASSTSLLIGGSRSAATPAFSSQAVELSLALGHPFSFDG